MKVNAGDWRSVRTASRRSVVTIGDSMDIVTPNHRTVALTARLEEVICVTFGDSRNERWDEADRYWMLST